MSVQTEQVDSVRAAGVREDDAPPGGPAALRKKRGGGSAPYLLLLPALLATALLLGYPLVKNGMLSFQNLNPRQLIQHLTEWNGVDNYKEVLGSSDFWKVVERSVFFTAANVVLIMLLGMLVGLLLARLGKKMRLLLMLGLVLAWAMPVIAATTVYQWLFAQRFGVVNYVLDSLGWHSMADYNWTSGQFSTFSLVTLVIVWQSIPFVAINLYAASTTIPKELYEAASLDGAGTWKSFTSVTLPFLKPFLLATTFLEVIWVFKSFAQLFAINRGGPDRLTETLPVYAFVEGVGNQHFGMGAAISFLTIIVLLALTGYYLRTVLKQEEDEL
ncbi:MULTISPECIES: carbohydrate ABC transporter permease [unclassified Streptomyces]|uniref:carbohydrate ABC transporter permease n=1 Tax=unclassified Streptomyces TaxID=2593676 RepID=UPI002255F6C3|nr:MULTISPECIES: sugar ABC transporter permease [unclassified Streptomyces]WSP57425.1 sugar ABC transporter permease [Streptomyces sp. NBC_01241]WSU21839.1 sugar ABC transporter permease [Streptomyces sp. NBC_01108]MCX4789269.1 sugar ABC transporter permease [Streptomyces sp. NBC_01221]MCX4795004.1 sugar ABC transporter permease [Streptomyces sp. NBC_01242]WSJ36296.1 sugar ABC transporter permease [Streptomyces sp. NBC_01321]